MYSNYRIYFQYILSRFHATLLIDCCYGELNIEFHLIKPKKKSAIKNYSMVTVRKTANLINYIYIIMNIVNYIVI